MEKKQTIAFISLSFVSLTYGISINSYRPVGNKVVKEGDPVTLQCIANDYFYYCDFMNGRETYSYSLDNDAYMDDSEYDIKKLNSGIDKKKTTWLGDLRNYNSVGCKIQIKSVTLNDAGKWSCKLEHWVNNPQTRGNQDIINQDDFATIEVTKDFEVTAEGPIVKTVEEGESVTLTCDSSPDYESCTFSHNDKKCTISFKPQGKRGEDITNLDCEDLEGKVEFTEGSKEKSSKKCSILLKNFEKEDAGQWTCELERHHGYGHGKGYGSIDKKEFTLLPAFDLISGQTRVDAVEHTKNTLDCEANQIYDECIFMHNGQKVMEDRIQGKGTKTCSLVFDDVTIADHGQYTCELSVSGITKNLEMELIVETDDEFKLAHGHNTAISVIKGETITLTCKVDYAFQWCQFKHEDEKACDVYSHETCIHYRFTPEAVMENSHTCSINVENANKENHNGKWTCQLKKYHDTSHIVSHTFKVNVTELNTITDQSSEEIEDKEVKVPEVIANVPDNTPDKVEPEDHSSEEKDMDYNPGERSNNIEDESNDARAENQDETGEPEAEGDNGAVIAVVIAVVAVVIIAIVGVVVWKKKVNAKIAKIEEEHEPPIIKNQTSTKETPEMVPLNDQNPA